MHPGSSGSIWYGTHWIGINKSPSFPGDKRPQGDSARTGRMRWRVDCSGSLGGAAVCERNGTGRTRSCEAWHAPGIFLWPAHLNVPSIESKVASKETVDTVEDGLGKFGDMQQKIIEEIADRLLPIYRHYRGKLNDLEVTEKKDRTLLTAADISVQNEIIKIIRSVETSARIIAEEDTKDSKIPAESEITWVIDPIDGTSQFVDPAAREFCSVIVRLYSGKPTHLLVLAPELGKARNPLIICGSVESRKVKINGAETKCLPSEREVVRRLSVTRSKGIPPREFEDIAVGEGMKLKTRTTSQSIDLLRLFFDLRPYSDLDLEPFDLFYRKDQKLWDGIGGLVLAVIAGYNATDLEGIPIIPIPNEKLDASIPTLPHTLIGTNRAHRWFMSHVK